MARDPDNRGIAEQTIVHLATPSLGSACNEFFARQTTAAIFNSEDLHSTSLSATFLQKQKGMFCQMSIRRRHNQARPARLMSCASRTLDVISLPECS